MSTTSYGQYWVDRALGIFHSLAVLLFSSFCDDVLPTLALVEDSSKCKREHVMDVMIK